MLFPKVTRYGVIPLHDEELANKEYVDAQIGGSPLTTKGDLFGFSSVNARIPIGTDGQRLTADAAETLGLKWEDVSPHDPNFDIVVKSVDETINSSTVLQNDDELTVALDANSSYFAAIFLGFNSDATPDFKYSFTIPTGALPQKKVNGTWDSSTSASLGNFTATKSVTVANTNSRVMMIEGFVIVQGTAGSLTLQWAQDTSDAANTTVEEGSTIRVWKA